MTMQRLAKTMVAKRSDSHPKTTSCLQPPATERGNLRISRALLPVIMALACLSGSIHEAGAASLSITRTGCTATLTWTNAADVLETNSALGAAIWKPVVGASSPYPITTCGTGANFYRLNLGGGGTQFSDNMVGYVNVALASGFTLIANQVNNLPDNTLESLFPAGTTTDLTVIYKFNSAIGGFASDQIVGGTWSGGGTTTVNPGEGAFIFTRVPFTATFVGEVQLRSIVHVPIGFSIVSSVIPQQGYLYDDYGGPDLGYGVPGGQSVYYQFINSLNGYTSYQYSGSWSCASCSGPYLHVGESMFVFSPASAEPHDWRRNFVVGPP